MSSVSNEPVSTLPPCQQGSSLVAEAQRLMTLSVNKIVASRSRRGGVSLHRNLLVAGVLFRARDALLAAGGKMLSQSSSSTPSAVPSGTSASETKQQQQPDTTSDDNCRTSSNPPLPPSADSLTSTTETFVGSAVAETKLCPHREIPVDAEDDEMDVEMVGKENVPPTATTSPASSELSKPAASETEQFMSCDKAVPQHQGVPASRKRSHSGSSPSCPIVEKSAKVVAPSESSSVQVSVGHASSKNVTCSPSSKQSSSSSSSSQSCSSSSSYGRSSVSVNPVVYVNRVDVAFCSTSGIGGGVIGSIRPVFVVQVV